MSECGVVLGWQYSVQWFAIPFKATVRRQVVSDGVKTILMKFPLSKMEILHKQPELNGVLLQSGMAST